MPITATKYTGRAMILKIGSTADPATAVFTVIGGVQAKAYTIGTEEIDISDGDDGVWKKLLEGGVQSIGISVSGLGSNDTQYEMLKSKAQTGAIWAFELTGIEDGDSVKGKFLATQFENNGEYKGAQQFSCNLVGADAPTFTNA